MGLWLNQILIETFFFNFVQANVLLMSYMTNLINIVKIEFYEIACKRCRCILQLDHIIIMCYQIFQQGGLNLDDLGFELVGGKDDPQFPNDNSIFVSHVTKGSAADGKLR